MAENEVVQLLQTESALVIIHYAGSGSSKTADRKYIINA
jgi:hypothetical protein